MKYTYIFIILISLGLLSCLAQGQKPDNTKPMYGEVEKNAEYQKADNEFKMHCMKQFGTLGDAAVAHIDFAWKYIREDNMETAMRRFNQAWLLDPKLPDSYFGFAFLMKHQNDMAESERFYNMAVEKDETGEGLKRYNQQVDIYENGPAVIEEFELSTLESPEAPE